MQFGLFLLQAEPCQARITRDALQPRKIAARVIGCFFARNIAPTIGFCLPRAAALDAGGAVFFQQALRSASSSGFTLMRPQIPVPSRTSNFTIEALLLIFSSRNCFI